MDQGGQNAPTYSIGAVARLTGLTTYTLRMWEHRYQAVVAAREPNGRRLYRPSDVEKLSLLKALSDRGSPIGSIASLDLEALRKRAEQEDGLQTGPAGRTLQVAVMGATLPQILHGPFKNNEEIQVLASATEPAQLAADLDGRRVDVLVLELPVLDADGAKLARSLAKQHAAHGALVVYRFGRRADIKALAQAGMALLQSPVSAEELSIALLTRDLPAAASKPGKPSAQAGELYLDAAEIPARRFNAAQLVRLAEIDSSIDCECPRHLAEILSSLGAFELYSKNCANRNEQDAALHAYLHRASAQARDTMEKALQRLAEVEKLEL